MNGTSPNILTLLFGVAPMPGGPTGKVLETPSPAVLFGDVMRTALGDGGRADSAVPIGKAQVLDTFMFGQLLGQTAGAVPREAGVEQSLAETSGYASNDGVWDFEGFDGADRLMPTVTDEMDLPELTAGSTVDSPVAEVNEKFASLLPLGSTTGVRSLGGNVSAMAAAPMFGAPGSELPAGEYLVTGQMVSEGMLTLDLVSAEAPDQVIRVSIPTEQLTAGMPVAPEGKTARVALDGMPGRQPLDSWFSKLQVKELVVTSGDRAHGNAAATVAPDGSSQFEMKMFAENAGQEVVIRANIARSLPGMQTQRESDVRVGVARTLDTQVETALTPRPTPPTVMEGQGKSAHEQALLLKGETVLKPAGANESGLPERILEGSSGLPDFARSTAELTMPREKGAVLPGRVILPQDIKQTLHPNGQSIQLRLDPEHLGPARLSLSMRDNQLRALVVVESPQARQVVEGQLDRLLDSLARADIKVGSIEVTVGQQAHEELLGQHQASWSRSRRASRFSGIAHESAGVPMGAVAAARVASSYIEAGGINVLA